MSLSKPKEILYDLLGRYLSNLYTSPIKTKAITRLLHFMQQVLMRMTFFPTRYRKLSIFVLLQLHHRRIGKLFVPKTDR